MPKKVKSTYLLAVHPGDEIAEEVSVMKLRLQDRLGRDFGSVNSLAHISLVLFQAYDEHYPLLLREFHRVLAGVAEFRLAFSGFGDFSTRPDCTFYIKPEKDVADAIVTSCQMVKKHFSKIQIRRFTESWKIVGLEVPHMTIGRTLKKNEIPVCYELFQEPFERSFECRHYVIRKFNPRIGQYEMIDNIPLLGQEYVGGQQIPLPLFH